MENNKNLDTKYQNLAAEYSKLRANAAVLKKAVLDEQARSRELKDQLKEHEQRLRKSNQEMESLTFRNQQLAKRISVLQEELDIKTSGKRSRGKSVDSHTSHASNMSLLDEELQKKIMNNAQLISAITDKDLEISNLRAIISELEEKLLEEQRQRGLEKEGHSTELRELARKHGEELALQADVSVPAQPQSDEAAHEALRRQTLELQHEAERWKTECELLSARNAHSDVQQREHKTKEYFYERIDELMGQRQSAQGLASSLTAECGALQLRLEAAIRERACAEREGERSAGSVGRLQEELQTTRRNYEQQLSTMSEHLADLNDKYTEQCELIQQLTFQLHGARPKKSK